MNPNLNLRDGICKPLTATMRTDDDKLLAALFTTPDDNKTADEWNS